MLESVHIPKYGVKSRMISFIMFSLSRINGTLPYPPTPCGSGRVDAPFKKLIYLKSKDDRSWLKAMMARSGPLVGNSELPDGPCGLPWDDLENHCFCYKSQLIITFPPLGLHLEFPYVDLRISIKIIENHWKAFASNAIWTSNFWHFCSYAAPKAIWS